MPIIITESIRVSFKLKYVYVNNTCELVFDDAILWKINFEYESLLT